MAGVHGVGAGADFHSGWLVELLHLAGAGRCFYHRCDRDATHPRSGGERWYEAHRNHAYQKLARRWGGHQPVTLLASGINVLWLAPLAAACTCGPSGRLVGCCWRMHRWWSMRLCWVQEDQSVNLVLYRVDRMIIYPFFRFRGLSRVFCRRNNI